MNCSGCGNTVESGSRFCNGCGCPIAVLAVPNKKTHSVVKLLAVFFALLFVGMIVGAITSSRLASTVSTSTSSPDHNKRLGIAAFGAKTLMKSMRNPDSFKLSSALIVDSTGSVCYTYRAQNGFGGMNVGQAVLAKSGKFKTSEMDGFSSLWNKECAEKKGTQEVDSVNHILKLAGD